MHRIRNPAYRFTCTEGSNPSLSAKCQATMGLSGPVLHFPHNFPHTLSLIYRTNQLLGVQVFALPCASSISSLADPHRTPDYPNPVWSPTQHFYTIPRNQSPPKSAITNNLEVSDARWSSKIKVPKPFRIFSRRLFF